MKKLLLTALVALSAWSSSALAADGNTRKIEIDGHKPILVVSLSGYDEIMNDVRYLSGLGGNEEFVDQMEAILKLFTAQKGLAGLDKSRPWGFAITSNEGQLPIFGFLPVTDLEELFEALAGFVGDPEKDEDGIWELEVQQFPLYVKEKNGWAYIGSNPTALDNLPNDAALLLGGLDKTYDLAISATPGNVPGMYRDLLMSQMKKFVDAGMSQKQKDETEEAFQQRKELAENAIKEFESAINDLERLTIGYVTNRETKKMQFDIAVSAFPGSKLAAQINAGAEPQITAFAGFQRPDALVNMHAIGLNTDAEAATQAGTALETATKQFDAALEKEEIPLELKLKLKAVKNSAMQLILANAKAGRADMAMAVVGEGPFDIIGGSFVADNDAADKVAQSLMDLAEEGSALSDLQRNVETYKGITFHSMILTIPEDIKIEGEKPALEETDEAAAAEPAFRIQTVQSPGTKPKKKKPTDDAKTGKKKPAAKPKAPVEEDEEAADPQQQMAEQAQSFLKFARATLGEKVPLIIGVGDGKMLLGAGQSALSELKKSLDLSAASKETKLQAFELSVRPGPMIKAAANANPDDAQLAALAQNEAANSTDRFRILAVPGKNSVTYRIELEEGVLKLFGALGAMAGPPGGLGAF